MGKGIVGYPYLKNLIELCPEVWEEHLENICESFCD